MPLRDHKQVMVGLDSLSERRVSGVGKAYHDGLVAPMLKALRAASGSKAALKTLGPGLIRKMDDDALVKDVGNALDQAAGIGMVSAIPRETEE